ncbi:MAG TPA: diguanylate cyclase [Rhodocyclaceae bacterium]|nr:diguanylate cyclase [Rhodocyclaceae bacterium]
MTGNPGNGNTTPGDVAKRTLTRLARERLTPTAHNYCVTYRVLRNDREIWTSYCRYVMQVAEALQHLLAAWSGQESQVESETARLARELDQVIARATSDADLGQVRARAEVLGERMREHLENSADLQAELLAVVQLLMENVGALADGDGWLKGQVRLLEEMFSGRITAPELNRSRKILRAVGERQAEIRTTLSTAQQELKDMLAELIRHAGTLVTHTAGFEARVTELQQHVSAANDLSSIRQVVTDLGEFVGQMGSSIRESHAEMTTAHHRLTQAEEQINGLRRSLAETYERARRDRLTGTLNRSGLEEIWLREVEQAKTGATDLSIGILDVDNFKALNDTHGHQVGDEALIHLASIIRNALHGTDTLARYGGEEFVVLLPDTDEKGAEAVMTRLQRELTKHFFLHGNERLLITFSAGVTKVQIERDTLISAVERADKALYKAKNAGKNRVVAG